MILSYYCRYWYNYGILYPDMGTVFIAIDKTDQDNGCLKVDRYIHKALYKKNKFQMHFFSADFYR